MKPTDDSQPDVSPMSVQTPPVIETWHPLLEGPPAWASGWGEDEIFGPFVEIKVGKAKQRLRWIPKGRFLMGSPEDEPGRIDWEGPQHVVSVGAPGSR